MTEKHNPDTARALIDFELGAARNPASFLERKDVFTAGFVNDLLIEIRMLRNIVASRDAAIDVAVEALRK